MSEITWQIKAWPLFVLNLRETLNYAIEHVQFLGFETS